MLNAKRLKSSYPDSVDKAAYLIAFNPEKLVHYGSSAKKAMYLSSSDIDLIEPIKQNEADDLARKIKKIVLNIAKEPLVYLGDFKSGLDPYYTLDIGRISKRKIIGYDKEKFRNFVQAVNFTHKKELLELSSSSITIPKFLTIQELMRKDQILRWSKAELLQGFKVLRGEKVMLADCIKDERAMTKIDTIQHIEAEGRLVEITNYFKLSSSARSFDAREYAESLKRDIVKLFYNGNAFKMCKRILSLELLAKHSAAAEKLFNIVHGGLGILYKIVADIKTIIYLLEHEKQPPVATIKSMIENFKWRLASIYEFEFKEASIDKLIDQSVADFQQLYPLLERLWDVLTVETRQRLKAIGLDKLPLKYYPK